MPNIFDGLAALVHRTTVQTMGYDATWSPFQFPLEIYAARVHFNDTVDFDTERTDNERVDPGMARIKIEYFRTDLWHQPGKELYASANGGFPEIVNIMCPDGVPRSFDVLRVNKILDGQTFEAELKLR